MSGGFVVFDDRCDMALRELRERQGLTLRDVEAKMGDSGPHYSTIARWERSNTVPKKYQTDFAQALGVSRQELRAVLAPIAPPPSTGHVTTEAAMATWMNRVITEGPDDPNLKLMLFVLQNYVDKTSWVVSGTIPQIAASASLPVGMVEDLWSELLKSPFIERVGSGEWTLRLVVPSYEEES